MNKIKVIYDAVKKIKDRNSIKGSIKVEGLKDQAKVLDVNSEFEKSPLGIQTKGKTIIEVDNDGKKMKLENSIDFKKEGGCEQHHFHHRAHPAGMKCGFGRITTILGILSSIKLDEKEDGSAILSLESADIPEEVKAEIQKAMSQRHELHSHMEGNPHHPMCMREFHEMDDADFTLNVFIDKNREVNKLMINVDGKKKDEKGEDHQLKLAAELCFEV